MSDDFNQYVVIPEAEYKSLLSQVQSQIQSMNVDENSADKVEKSVSKLDSVKTDKIERGQQQQQQQQRQEGGGEGGAGVLARGEELEEEEIRGAAGSKKRKPLTTTPSDFLFEELCSAFDAYFPSKHRSRVISLLKRLSATGRLQIEAANNGSVQSVTLGAHRYPILVFTDILEIVQTLKTKPESSDTNLRFFVKFLSDYEVPKTLVYNPYVRNYDVFLSSDSSSRPQKSVPAPTRVKSAVPSRPRKDKSKKTPSVRNKNTHTRLKWYISERNVSDDSD